MDSLLTPIRTISTSQADEFLKPAIAQDDIVPKKDLVLESSQNVLEALKSKPDFEALKRILRWLDPKHSNNNHFDIRTPSPQAAQILFHIVEFIIPDYWLLLNASGPSSHHKQRSALIRSLFSVAGINALVSRLRVLWTQTSIPTGQDGSKETRLQPIKDLLGVIEVVFRKESHVNQMWNDISNLNIPAAQKALLWKEFISLEASGKVLSVAAQANQVINDLSADIEKGTWLGQGDQYARWLGSNVCEMMKETENHDVEAQKALGQFLSKSLKIGHPGTHVSAIFTVSLTIFTQSRLLKCRGPQSSGVRKPCSIPL